MMIDPVTADEVRNYAEVNGVSLREAKHKITVERHQLNLVGATYQGAGAQRQLDALRDAVAFLLGRA